ncbi:MAG: lactonase family protein [Pirellulales bacterium]|nr:lactonase family protein [Pirellulales bacterium]
MKVTQRKNPHFKIELGSCRAPAGRPGSFVALRSIGIRLHLVVLLLITSIGMVIADDSIPVYIGTYTQGTSCGIYQARLDTASGKLHSLALAAELESPSFIAFHPTKPVVYAVGELSHFDGKPEGAVSALKRDSDSGELALLNQQPSGGIHPCHLSVTPSGQFVMVANYSSGSIACFPIQEDGCLAPMAGFVQHEGSSVHASRQAGPHAHSIRSDPEGRCILAADLGLDKILIYRLDAGQFIPNDPACAMLPPGSGPRHIAFHPSGRYVYVINELLSTITAFRYASGTGSLTEIQTVTTLPETFKESNTTAEIQVHPTGQFLYGSNRGHDSIAAFRIDPDTGLLTPLGQTRSGGKWPRNFTVDPTGHYLLAAHQATDNIVVHRIHPETGLLEPIQDELAVDSPVCVQCMPGNRRR